MKVLVIDDEPLVLEMIAEMLRADGHQTGMAPSAHAGLVLLAPSLWDLVVVDRMMPSRDGEQVARHVKKVSPATPVIMITGAAPGKPPAGVDLVLSKPFNHVDLRQAVSRLLQPSQG